MYDIAVCIFIGNALGVEARMFLINIPNLMGSNRQVFIQYKGDSISHLNIMGIRLLHINQRSHRIFRLHTSAEYAVWCQPYCTYANKHDCQNHDCGHQNTCHPIPYFSNCRMHLSSLLISFMPAFFTLPNYLSFFLSRI